MCSLAKVQAGEGLPPCSPTDIICSFEWEELVGRASTRPMCTDHILLLEDGDIFFIRVGGRGNLLLPSCSKNGELPILPLSSVFVHARRKERTKGMHG